VSVPDQLSVAGFDDTELARHLSPALTTVRSDPLGWGIASAKLLLDVIEAGSARGPAQPSTEKPLNIHIDLPPAELVLRDSCAPPPPPSLTPRAARRRTAPSNTRPSTNRTSNSTESEKA
jgi:DNA-binding LacI/PurR family transcriptional regulator